MRAALELLANGPAHIRSTRAHAAAGAMIYSQERDCIIRIWPQFVAGVASRLTLVDGHRQSESHLGHA